VSQATLPLPALAPGRMLTKISGQDGTAVITPNFMTGGSVADLGEAVMVYDQAKQYYEASKATMSAVELAVTKTEMAIAKASIIVLGKVLDAQNGVPVDLAELIAAYQAAKAELNNNRSLLTADQIKEAKALLKAIAIVISRFSS
jgi:hypothetical protein